MGDIHLGNVYDTRVLCASGTCLAPTEAERRKNCESTKYETIHMASHNFHNFTKFDRSNYDLKCKKSDAWFW